jgi:23S rRNA pseudouridine1911/1915/1917 synthase
VSPLLHEVVPGVLAGERLDRAVAMLTGRARSEVAGLVAAGAVRVAGRVVTTRSRRLLEGDVVEVDLPESTLGVPVEADPSVVVPVVAVDADVIVVDKPAGMVVHPGAGQDRGTMVQGLLARFPDLRAAGLAPRADPRRPGIVHRLDKGTSGLLVVARTADAYVSLVRQLGERQVERAYLTLVWGEVVSERGLIDAPLGRASSDPTRMAVVATGREARTGYEVVARFTSPAALTLLSCRLETGRTHQIRAHLAAIGHPVAGDDRYGGQPVAGLVRPFLHAAHLAFLHPARGERQAYDAPLPADLDEVRGQLS